VRGKKMNRILIIEDEQMTAKAVKEALELNGMSADIAEDGIKGIELVKKVEYDLILLDLKMPKLGVSDLQGLCFFKNFF
jgi:DNA-binding response OmpR family regulator